MTDLKALRRGHGATEHRGVPLFQNHPVASAVPHAAPGAREVVSPLANLTDAHLRRSADVARAVANSESPQPRGVDLAFDGVGISLREERDDYLRPRGRPKPEAIVPPLPNAHFKALAHRDDELVESRDPEELAGRAFAPSTNSTPAQASPDDVSELTEKARQFVRELAKRPSVSRTSGENAQ